MADSMTETPHNPYMSPATQDDPRPVHRPDVPTVIAIAFLSLVAAAGAFFGTCVGTVFIAMGLGVVTLHNGPDNWGAILHAISTLAALVVAVRIFQWRYRKETVSGTIYKPASNERARVAIAPVASRDALKMHGGGNADPQIADSVTETPPNPYERPATHDDLSPVRRPDTPTFIAIVLWSLVAAASTFFRHLRRFSCYLSSRTVCMDRYGTSGHCLHRVRRLHSGSGCHRIPDISELLPK